jgi:hypothetical protein
MIPHWFFVGCAPRTNLDGDTTWFFVGFRLLALGVTFFVGLSPLTATLLFSQQQEQSKQKSAARAIF